MNTPYNKSSFLTFWETLSATLIYNIHTIGIFGSLLVTCYLAYSKFFLLVILYLLWIWQFDASTSEQAGRDFTWFRNWTIWNNTKNYFPIKTKFVQDTSLDITKNYLFCCHPHGIMPWGVHTAFIKVHADMCMKSSGHRYYTLTLKFNFYIPFYREFLLAIGSCDVSAKSITYLMSKPSGGNVAILFPGGAAEAFLSKPGRYRIVLKNRKGFIKLALTIGCPIVPVLSFGEIDIFQQPNVHDRSLLRTMQEWVKFISGFVPIFYFGRYYLPIPKRLPINIVVGAPIHINKIDNPSQENIDKLHNEYIQSLVELFEQNKRYYVTDADTTQLIID